MRDEPGGSGFMKQRVCVVSDVVNEREERQLKTWFIVARSHHMVCVAFANSLRELDLTAAQHELLANLLVAHPDGLTQRQLAEHLFVTKGNITGLVKRLEARGLVAREEDPGDRRKNNVTLTVEGKQLAHASLEKQRELVSHIFGHFDAGDDEQLRSLMKTLRMGIKDYQAL